MFFYLCSFNTPTEVLFRNAILKTGAKTITDKSVEWVFVMESPVENFVRENEFVLSTGIGCHEKTDELLSFIKDVYDSEASALTIATGRYIYEIPEEVLEFAIDPDFIIVELLWEIRFADIVHEVKKLAFSSTFATKSHELGIRLAEKVAEMTPGDLSVTFFTSGG